MANNKALLPKLRFPEFRDAGAWATEELANFSELIKDKAGKKKYTLMSVTAGVGLISQIEKFGREIAGAQYKNYFVIQKNDFAYNKSATKDYPEGFIALYEGNTTAAVPNSIFTCFRVKENEILPKFLNYLFLNNLHGRWLRKFITIGARAHGSLNIDNKDLLSLPVPMPQGNSAKKEQQKIVDCLFSLDTLIAAQTKLIDVLKNHKKGLMQRLFPRESEAIPRLRFPEFRNVGEWTTKELGKLGEVLMCKRIFADQTNDQGDIPFFKIGTLGGEPDSYISKELFEKYKTNYNYPKKDEVLITCSGTVGKCLCFDGKDAYFQDSNIVWIDNPALEISNKFLHLLLLNVDWSRLNSTTITRIYGSDLRNLSLTFPSLPEEQKKIAECLSSLDALIVAHVEKLDILKTHKKGLMQQLFPSPETVAV